MLGAIMVSHGKLSKGLKDSVEMISGRQKNIKTVSLNEGDGLESLKESILIKYRELKCDCDDVLIFVDMFGATTFNSACLVCVEENCCLITGMTLPLILTFCVHQENYSLKEMIDALSDASQEDFKIVTRELLKGGTTCQ